MMVLLQDHVMQIFIKDVKINIFSETFKEEFEEKSFDLKPIKCPFKVCNCLPDTHITKYIS